MNESDEDTDSDFLDEKLLALKAKLNKRKLEKLAAKADRSGSSSSGSSSASSSLLDEEESKTTD